MRWPYILSLIALLGASLLLFFNILCGASTSSVLGKWYWLQADTGDIPGAHGVTRWTNYASCGVNDGRNVDCSSKSAGYPISPVLNFGTTEGVPSGLTSKHGTVYYLSKVGWAFLLIGLFFTVLALVPVLLIFRIPSLSALNIITSSVTIAAFVFIALSASLLTAGVVKARDAFRDDGKSTSLGKTMLGFIWASVALLFLSSLFSGFGCVGNFSKKKKERSRYSENYDASSHDDDTYGNNDIHEKQAKRALFFKKKKRTNDVENANDANYAAGLGTGNQTTATNPTPVTAIGTGVVAGGAGAGAVGAGSAFGSSNTKNLEGDQGKVASTNAVFVEKSTPSGYGAAIPGTTTGLVGPTDTTYSTKPETVSNKSNLRDDIYASPNLGKIDEINNNGNNSASKTFKIGAGTGLAPKDVSASIAPQSYQTGTTGLQYTSDTNVKGNSGTSLTANDEIPGEYHEFGTNYTTTSNYNDSSAIPRSGENAQVKGSGPVYGDKGFVETVVDSAKNIVQ